MSIDKELEEQLLEVGNKLAVPPSSVEEVLQLLDQVESLLLRVGQAPSSSMENALSPSLKALIANKLLQHSDDNVKVAVGSCISEITRITAPEAPYDDDQMKDVFQLIVSAFENLHDKLSQSYAKRISILETVARVRSCVVMLDLECDALILEMFWHFLKTIREHHPANVFSSMETIMTLVLEESEDISLDLLSPLLTSIKKDHEEACPIAQKLGEKVLESCSTKLKPYLVQAVKSLGISVDDYSMVLASIFQEVNKDSREVTPSQQENPDGNISPKSVMSNGVTCVGDDNDLDTEKVDNSKQKSEHSTKRRQKKPTTSTKSAKRSKGEVATNAKETENESHSRKVPCSPSEDHSVEAAVLPKACYNESEVLASPPSESFHEENLSKKLGRTKMKDGSVREGAAENVSKVSGGASDSEAKPARKSVKKAHGQISDAKKTSVVDSLKKRSDSAIDADTEKHSAKKLDNNKKGIGGSSSRQMGDKKKGCWRKEMLSSPKSGTKSTKDENPETPKTTVMKLTSGKENESDTEKYGENVVGLRVKVWWPKDREFYKGVIHSFDSAKKKHKVFYDDGDEETLNLVKEKWKVIDADSDADEEEQREPASLDASTDMPPKKKGETSVGESNKQGKTDPSSRSDGVIASSRSLDVSMKSSHKSKDGKKSKGSNTTRKLEDVVSVGESNKQGKMDPSSRSDGAVTSTRSKGVSMKSNLKSKDGNKSKNSKTNRKSEDEVGVGESNRQGKTDPSSKSDGAIASHNSKGVSMKSTHKSKDGNKSEDSKTISKSEDEVCRKSKDSTAKNGSRKSVVADKKLSNKLENTDTSKTIESKDDEINMPKSCVKSKHEAFKGEKSKLEILKTTLLKGKRHKSGGKIDVGNGKSGLLKRKYPENDSDVSAGEVKDVKGKTSHSSKLQGSELKSGKKRQRN
ncbi:uncharacterized protein LOC114163817 [Vigna unguiculata]|uniref:uncharacterized protein LOC114163817 n=1 Tax=Vigna unguiculata TaxID=3917 RepID=UPI001015CEAA|nr:uncharacterized protein LOC114163817 [Vigna unguiculata]